MMECVRIIERTPTDVSNWSNDRIFNNFVVFKIVLNLKLYLYFIFHPSYPTRH